MSRLVKLGLVIGGYVAACLIASGAVYMNQLFTQGAASQASAGMSAFGDLILFICEILKKGSVPRFLGTESSQEIYLQKLRMQRNGQESMAIL